jgi:S-adenosylmethionine synthetase
VSEIGRPIDEPHTLDLAVVVGGAPGRCAFERAVRAIANDHLARIAYLGTSCCRKR